MFFLDVMYYYAYLQHKIFLKNISSSDQPLIILGALLSFPLILLIRVLYIKFFCLPPSAWVFIAICFGCIFLMFKIYKWNGREKDILIKKPFFFNHKKSSISISVLFEIISLTTLFLGGPIGKYLLEQCGWLG